MSRAKTQAPKGRNNSAQGNALGKAAPGNQSPVGAGQLGDLLAGWQNLNVGEMVELVQYGSSAKTSEDATGVPVLRMGNIQDGKLDLECLKYLPHDHAEFPDLLLKDGDLLFNRTNSAELVGKSAVYRGNPPKCSCASYLIRVRLKPEFVPEYLSSYLNSPYGRQWIASVVSQQVGQANVNGTKLKALSVPVPGFDDQRRIVAEIEKQFTRLEAGVAALRRVQANLKRYRAAVLKAACEGRLVPTEAELARTEGRSFESGQQLLARILTERRQNWQGRGKYKEPAAPNITELSHLPDGWTWTTAEQLTDENRSITYGVIKLGAPIADGVHVLRSSDVRHLKLDLEGVKRIDPEIANEYQRTFLKGGEVLMTVRGTLGGVVVAPPECKGFNISREVAMLAMIEPSVAKIAAIFIGSDPLQHWLLKRAKGIAYTGINIETLKELPIPLPPLAEQTRIVAEVERRLSVAEELEAVVTTNLQRATRLRQSILQKAFAGQLCTD